MERSAKSAHGALLLVAGALGFGALKTGIDDIVKAGTNYQEQQAQLQAALHSTHQASREHTKSLGETATSSPPPADSPSRRTSRRSPGW